MEYWHSEKSESDQTPEEAGELNTSKKRRKKQAKLAKSSVLKKSLPIKEDAEASEKKKTTLFEKKSPAEGNPENEDEQTAGNSDQSLEIELPLPKQDELRGELIIDHSEKSSEASEAEVDPAELDIGAVVEASAPESVESPPQSEPPRVAPPLFFELPPEVLNNRPDAMATGSPVSRESPAVPHATEQSAPIIPQHELHRQAMFDPSTEKETKAEDAIPSKEAHQREHTARKRGVSSGVLAGGLAGWWLGNRHGKRAETQKLKPAIEDQSKKIEQLAWERDLQKNLYDKRLNILERTQSDFDVFMKKTWEHKILGRAEQDVPAAATAEAAEVPPVPEAFSPVYVPEQAAPLRPEAPSPQRTEGIASPAEKTKNSEQKELIENQPITEELYMVPEQHRVETSAWHRIEVDKATGRAVEKPAVSYGEAFVKEQKQEKLARDAAKAQTAAQLGMTVLMPAASGTNQSTAAHSQPVAATRRPSGNKQATAGTFKSQLPYIRSQLASRTTNPATWAVSGGLVVVLFAIGVL